MIEFLDWGYTSYCIEMFISCLIFMLFLEKRQHFGGRLAVCFSSLLLIVVVFLSGAHSGSRLFQDSCFFIIYILTIAICYVCCKISWPDAIYCASCAYLAQHIASSVYILCVFHGYQIPWEGWDYYLIFILIFLIMFFTVARWLPEHGKYQTDWGVALLTAGIVLAITWVLSIYVKNTIPNLDDVHSVSAEAIRLFKGCQMYAISVCIIFLVLQVFQKKQIRIQRELNQREQLWQKRQTQYEMTKENIQLINTKCHDLKHQIHALGKMDGENVKRENFVKEVENMIEVYDSGSNTGNEALDVILMEKGLYCRMHEIEWTCVADGECLDFVDVIDLYTIMGNALDNAIEHVEGCGQEQWKTIAVRIWKKEMFAVIQVENSFDGTLICDEDGMPKTRKKDKENHGFGVRSIRTIAEKYEGTISIKTEDDKFILTVLLPIMS